MGSAILVRALNLKMSKQMNQIFDVVMSYRVVNERASCSLSAKLLILTKVTAVLYFAPTMLHAVVMITATVVAASQALQYL